MKSEEWRCEFLLLKNRENSRHSWRSCSGPGAEGEPCATCRVRPSVVSSRAGGMGGCGGPRFRELLYLCPLLELFCFWNERFLT